MNVLLHYLQLLHITFTHNSSRIPIFSLAFLSFFIPDQEVLLIYLTTPKAFLPLNPQQLTYSSENSGKMDPLFLNHKFASNLDLVTFHLHLIGNPGWILSQTTSASSGPMATSFSIYVDICVQGTIYAIFYRVLSIIKLTIKHLKEVELNHSQTLQHLVDCKTNACQHHCGMTRTNK